MKNDIHWLFKVFTKYNWITHINKKKKTKQKKEKIEGKSFSLKISKALIEELIITVGKNKKYQNRQIKG